MGRVSPSKQNQYGKERIQIQNIPTPIRQERSRRDMRTSASSTAVQSRNPVEGVPTRPSQPTGGKMYGALPPTVNQNLGAYDSSVTLPGMTRGLPSDYKETEQQAGAKAEASRAGAGFGSEQRVSRTGVVQKGTNTSPKPMTMDDANKLLTGGYKMNQDYASNQLPYTQSSPYAGKGNAEIYNPETLHQHDSDVDYVSLSKDIYGDQSGVESYTRGGEMNKDYEQMDVNLGQSTAGKPEKSIPKRPSGARQAEKWDRKYGGADFSGKSEAPATSGFDMERRAAFLGGSSGKKGDEGFVGSMQALRRTEALQNMTYAGGKHYIGEGNGSDKLIEVGNKQDVGRYKMGEEGARQIRDKYVNALTSKGDYSEYQSDAPAPLPDAVPGNSDIDKSQLDTSDLMDMNPSESIIGNNTPSRTVKKGTLFNT